MEQTHTTPDFKQMAFDETAAERYQLKEENERLKLELEKWKNGPRISPEGSETFIREANQLRDLNRELLEALKEMYMYEYGGNSVTIEDAIGRAPKSLIRKNDFEQKIISLIQKAS